MDQQAPVFSDMTYFIGQALAAARKDGFSTLVVGNSYAVITREARLDEILDGCLAEMVDSVLERRASNARPRAG